MEQPAGPGNSSSEEAPWASEAQAAAAAAAGGGGPRAPPNRPATPPAAVASGVAARMPPGPCPCLASTLPVVPSQAHGSYRRHILVAIDNSSNSQQALEFAARHMYRRGDKLHLVHVVPEPPTLHGWPGVYLPPDDALEREEFKEAAAMVAAAFAPLVTPASIPCDAHLIVAPSDPGSIANILLDKQGDLGAAALVVGPHGKGSLQEWWLGSVTRALLRHSPVPVVVVPPGLSSHSNG